MSNLDPVFLIEIDCDQFGTQIIGEREDSKADVLSNLLSGEYGKVLKVLEVIEDEGSVRNVTEDFARDVADALHSSRDPVTWEMANWLQHHLGVSATRSLNFVQAAE